MKGSRQNQSAITSDISGEPILRPFTGTSKFSNGRRTVSPTFDLNTSISGQSPMKDAEDPMQTVMNEPMVYLFKIKSFSNILNNKFKIKDTVYDARV